MTIIRLTIILLSVISSLKGFCQVELKIEQSKYFSLDSAAVFYCKIDTSLNEIFRFDFDSFLYDEISWYFDRDRLIFYYTTRTLLSTCSSSGNNEIKLIFGCYLLQCATEKVELIKIELVSNQNGLCQNFRDIVIKDEELVFVLNKQEVNRVLLAEVSKNQIVDFVK